MVITSFCMIHVEISVNEREKYRIKTMSLQHHDVLCEKSGIDASQ